MKAAALTVSTASFHAAGATNEARRGRTATPVRRTMAQRGAARIPQLLRRRAGGR